MDFGPTFIKRVKIRINLNGFLSKGFKQTRGLRQGCAPSALLYVLYAEPLAHAVRSNRNSGIKMAGGETLKITQYADDTVLYVHR